MDNMHEYARLRLKSGIARCGICIELPTSIQSAALLAHDAKVNYEA